MRLQHQHLVTRFAQPEDGGGQRLGGADRHQHLGVRVELLAVVAQPGVRDGLPQCRDARVRAGTG